MRDSGVRESREQDRGTEEYSDMMHARNMRIRRGTRIEGFPGTYILAHWTDNTPVSPSVLRKFFITTVVRLRAETPATFTVTPACMLLVGGTADDAELRALGTPLVTPPCMPVWIRTVQYDLLLPPDGTFIAFCELETTWWPRLFPSRRWRAPGP